VVGAADVGREPHRALTTLPKYRGLVALASDEWDENVSRIVQANRDSRVAELRLRSSVYRAHQAGRSWITIAVALGLSEQEAEERFG
jgi:hypothetical protein